MSNRFLTAAAAAFLIFSCQLTTVSAQQLSSDERQRALGLSSEDRQRALQSLSPEDRQRALQSLGTKDDSSDAPPASTARKASPRPLSAAEQQQVIPSPGALALFGYSLFAGAGNALEPSAEVPISDNYVLGPGDIIRVQLFGNQNETLNLSVTRDGSVNFPKLGPIQLAGLSIENARAVIDRRVSKELIGVQTNISMGPLRGMQVFMLGEARMPGAYSVSGLATITNALIAGGGVATTGSLRKIELKRGGRTIQRIDLYDFLLRGDASRDARLQAGDVLFIPTVGPRVAIAGAVIRPAVYEMSAPLSVKAALELAGGLIGNARRAEITLERIDANGQRQLRALDLRDASIQALTLRDGDRLDVGALYEKADNPVSVLGHVRYEKSFAWTPQMTLDSLLSIAEVRASEPGRELYPVMALIERTDLATGLRSWRGFDLAAVQAGASDEPVQALDRVIVLTRSDINYLLAAEVRNALAGSLPKPVTELAATTSTAQTINPETKPGQGNLLRRTTGDTEVIRPSQGDVCPALIEVVKMSDSARAIGIRVLLESQVSAAENRFSQASSAEARSVGATTVCPAVFRAAPTALPYLLEHSAGLVGEIKQPGLYPFVDGMPLARLTAVAGGETSEANRAEIEFFDVNEVIAGDTPRFRKVQRDVALAEKPISKAIYKFLPAAALPEVGAVNVRGEVRFPGRYVIARGERYSELLARAGGLNDDAYAYGTVFTRASARTLEAVANRRAAADLRESLVSSATQGFNSQNASANTSSAVLELVQRLENTTPVGRVVVEADPAVLGGRPGADFLLEPGDEIFVPKRPNSVSVSGQVLSPGSLAFVSGADPEEYIRQAGGYSQAADAGRAFLILPNGIARPLRRSFWAYREDSIPPGSVIVVPRDVSPYTALILTERITSILSNLALSAAALVTINR